MRVAELGFGVWGLGVWGWVRVGMEWGVVCFRRSVVAVLVCVSYSSCEHTCIPVDIERVEDVVKHSALGFARGIQGLVQ